VSFVLAALIEKSFPKQYAERCEETNEEEVVRQMSSPKPIRAAVDDAGRGPQDEGIRDFVVWSSPTFFSECLGRGCFIID
jgi:hypothetical protein